jgi:hypothetical protein
VIAEVIPEAYDAKGHQVSQPFLRRKGPHPTFPMGRYVSQPLTVRCASLEEMREFLCKCRPMSDEKLFGKRDYWQPPEEFEKRKAGDCEDFSFWTWRQLLEMGFDARVVFGRHGRYGIGHAWVLFFQDDRCFLVEPQAAPAGLKLPRLSTLRYEPKYSVTWNGSDLKYYAHKSDPGFHVPLKLVIPLIPEWLEFWGWFWIKVAVRIPVALARRIRRAVSKKNPQSV